jgi:hypothetical protein
VQEPVLSPRSGQHLKSMLSGKNPAGQRRLHKDKEELSYLTLKDSKFWFLRSKETLLSRRLWQRLKLNRTNFGLLSLYSV